MDLLSTFQRAFCRSALCDSAVNRVRIGISSVSKPPFEIPACFAGGIISKTFNVKVRGSAWSQNVDAHASFCKRFILRRDKQRPGDKQQEIDAIAMWVTQLGHSTWAPAQTDGTRARLKVGRLGAR